MTQRPGKRIAGHASSQLSKSLGVAASPVRRRGTIYDVFRDIFRAFEKRKTKHLRVIVVFIPASRDELLPALVAGRGDIAAANLTITPKQLRPTR